MDEQQPINVTVVNKGCGSGCGNCCALLAIVFAVFIYGCFETVKNVFRGAEKKGEKSVKIVVPRTPESKPAQSNAVLKKEMTPEADEAPKIKVAVHEPEPAKFATVAQAQQEALRRYPELGISGSKFNAEFLVRYQRYQREKSQILQDNSWPLRVAEEVGEAIGQPAHLPPAPSTPVSATPARKPTQAEADMFLGITEAALIQRLGRPIKIKTDNSPDGPFKLLEFDQTKGSETFFIIFADDGLVQSGMLRGVRLTAK